MSGGSGDFQQTLNELERRLRELLGELVKEPETKEPEAKEPEPTQPERPAGPPPMPPYRPGGRDSSAPPAGGLQDQLDELLRFRDQLAEAAKTLVDDYSRLLEQITRIVQAPAPPPGPPPPTPAAGHATFPVPPPAAPAPESTVFSGEVEIEAGPFAEIAALAAFEEALRGVPHAEEVHVRSFKRDRARIELRLAAEVPLVFELRRASDQGFDVEEAEPGRLRLTMHPRDLPFPARP